MKEFDFEPYATPQEKSKDSATEFHGKSYKELPKKIKRKGMILGLVIFTMGVAVIFTGIGVISNLVLSPGFPDIAENRDEMSYFEIITFGCFAIGLIYIPAGVVMIIGGIKIIYFENYSLALASAILALLPNYICGILSFVIAGWALIVLMNGEVKEAFHSIKILADDFSTKSHNKETPEQSA
ncbi:Hypothetical protein PBC10988_20350 [Planctomycetales bacterium 10988]|nr:Hypothetical protein PBC10988_20350 [Planctomycetales bacterium 10988]